MQSKRVGAGIFVAIVGALSFEYRACADDTPAVPQYVICPVTTGLQKKLLRFGGDVCVVIDVSEAVKGKDVSAANLNLEKLKDDLKRHVDSKKHVNFEPFFGSNDDYGSGRLVHYALVGLGHELGFAKTSASGIHWANGFERTWEEHAKPRLGKDEGEEPVSGNDDVKVYPVKTRLSRYLSSNADAVVFMEKGVDTDHGMIPEKIRKAVFDLLKKLNLGEQKYVSFTVWAGKLTDTERQLLMKEIDLLMKEMALRRGTYTGG